MLFGFHRGQKLSELRSAFLFPQQYESDARKLDVEEGRQRKINKKERCEKKVLFWKWTYHKECVITKS